MRSTNVLYNCSVPISSEYIHYTSQYTAIIAICMYTSPLFFDQHKIAQVLAEFIVPLVSHLIPRPRDLIHHEALDHPQVKNATNWSCKKYLRIYYIGAWSPFFSSKPPSFFLTALQCQLMNSDTWVSERGATSNLHLFYRILKTSYPRLVVYIGDFAGFR